MLKPCNDVDHNFGRLPCDPDKEMNLIILAEDLCRYDPETQHTHTTSSVWTDYSMNGTRLTTSSVTDASLPCGWRMIWVGDKKQ